MKSIITHALAALAGGVLCAALAIWLAPRPSAPADEHGHGHGSHGPKEKEEDHAGHEGHDHGGEEKGSVRLPEEAVTICGIKSEKITTQHLTPVIAATATIRPNADTVSHIRPRVSGRVTEVQVRLGQKVKKGDPLVVLDSVELGLTKAEYLKAKSLLEVAKSNYDRQQALYESPAGKIATERTLQEAKSDFMRAEAEVRSLREKLVLFGVAPETVDGLTWENSKTGLSLYTLTSPFDGIVIEKHVALGEVVDSDDDLFTLADLSVVWILIDVFQQDAPRVHVGQRVEISSDILPGEVFEGKLRNVGAVLSEETRTLQARVEVPNSDLRLKPGMFVRANIRDVDPEHSRTSIAIPVSAVQYVDNLPIAFVEQKPCVYQKRDLLLGARFGDLWEVLKGVKEGDSVVTNGAFILKSELMREKIGGHTH